MRLIQTGFGVAVVAALCVPLLVWWFGPRNLAREKPGAAPWPERPRTRLAVRVWPAAVEDFVQNHIGLRDAATWTYNSLLYFGLRASPTPKVVLGREGWLFYNSGAEPLEAGSDAMADARRSRPLNARKLDAIADMILAREALVSSWHGRYLFVVVPNKSSVYPEYLPGALTPIGKGKPLEQLAARLEPAPGGPFVDLTPILLASKQRGATYYRTDSHWNERGALDGFREIMRVLAADHPDLRTPQEDDFIVQQWTSNGRDLAMMLDLAPLFREPAWHLLPRAALVLPAFQRALKVRVYRDSFYDSLPDVWRAYLPNILVEPSSTRWLDEDVRAARPDVVIQVTVERRLRYKGRRPDPFL